MTPGRRMHNGAGGVIGRTLYAASVRVAVIGLLLGGCSLQRAGIGDDGTPLIEAGVDSALVADSALADTGVVEPDTTLVADDSALDVSVDAEEDVLEADVPFDAGCPTAKAGANPCTEIPAREALATGQLLDGRADDFCDVPYVDFDNTKGVIRVPESVPGDAKATMRIRVAWSSFGLHAHLGVTDSKVIVHTADERVFLGDSVEIYVAGYDALTGAFDGTTRDVGAQQIVFSAVNAIDHSRATYFYMGSSRGSPPALRWSARTTTTGYEIELRIPWADLKPFSLPAPTAGKRIALTWALNNKVDATRSQVFSVFQVKTTSPMPTSCAGGPQPFCDDRMWCTPTLL